MKHYLVIGIALGLALAFLSLEFGFFGFVVGLIFGAIGGVIGAHYEGKIDLRHVVDTVRKRD
ncbi:hypothetical protein L1O03_01695 [Corynebacterium uropygiale]|uniref:DUF2273 domain-containing protein n=1 Tax=Corynebacterium uropygiale TaxID=1775911 RepID=A0A9X1QQC8_9CORY|nr:hypothetical protein [Corynebacterium uropygiale]MCF4005888.1 hypothetical protein [Corynebacterium uropygiale]